MNIVYHEMDFVVRTAHTEPDKWFVMIFPPNKGGSSGNKRQAFLRQMFACACPADAALSGRTVILSNGSRVSFADVNQDIFIPSDTPFKIFQVGWEGSDSHQGLKKWLKRANFLFQKN